METWCLAFVLILARTATFIVMLPLLGGRQLPRTVKIGLSVALAGLWFSTFGLAPAEEVLTLATRHSFLAYAVAICREVVFGAMLGYAFSLFLLPAQIAGAYVSQEMGLTLATVADPMSSGATNVVSQLFESLAVLLFFALDGHHVLLTALHVTFARRPIGTPLELASVDSLARGVAEAHEWGLLIVAPAAICLFITVVVLALLMKVAPQMNLFTVGLTVRLIVGLAASLAFLPEMVWYLSHVFGHAEGLVERLIGS